jgi:tellurite methyltransferase
MPLRISPPPEYHWYAWQQPHERLVSLAAAMRARGTQRLLDLGCGAGRHLVYLAQQGFALYGVDLDPYGLARARRWLEQEGLPACLAVADMETLPYPDGFFDAVISTSVIHHNTVDGIRRTVVEVQRLLRPGGWFFATLNARGDYKEGRGPQIEPGTWLVKEFGCDMPSPHHLFQEDELRAVWDGFRLVELERKAYQFQRGDPPEILTSAHWEVLAEKPSP